MAHLNGLCESWRPVLRRFRHGMAFASANWRCRIPGTCPLCSGPARGGLLCVSCQGIVTAGMRGASPRCPRCCLRLDACVACPDCEASVPVCDRIIAAFDYEAPADVLIHRLKVQRRFTDVPALAHLLADEVVRVWPDFPPDLVLTPVPSSRAAIRQRGFNPAAEVCRLLARRLRLPCRPGLLQRVHEGRKQAMLGREARLAATSRLYRVAANATGQRIAVVDDVLTTGSTMHSIARMLKRSGAVSVHGLVLARTPRSLS